MNYWRQSNTFQFEEDPFSKNAESLREYYQGVSILMNFLQTKPGVTRLNFTYFGFYYTVIKYGNEKIIIHNEYECKENDYNKYDD